MKNKVMFDGFILGMEESGGKHVKTDENFVYFKVEIGSNLDREEALQRSKTLFMNQFGLGIKIARVKEL